MTPATAVVTFRPDLSGFIAALAVVQKAAMVHTLAQLERAAMKANACPTFTYDLDPDELTKIAPIAAGRFKLRAEIDAMKKRLEETA